MKEVFVMKKRIPKHKQVWQKIRKKAPKVPDITCPIIDDVQKRLGNIADREEQFKARSLYAINKKLEKLRTMNEQLRDSGQYWHDECQKLIDDFFKNRKYRF